MAAIVIAGYARDYTPVVSPKVSGAAKGKKFYGTGRINMPGGKMTWAGKRRQMQKDVNRKSPRRGKRR